VQRIYLDALDARLNNSSPPPKIRALLRGELRSARADIVRALPAVTDRQSRLHLEDARDQIDEILDPRAMRDSVVAAAGGGSHHPRATAGQQLEVRLEQRSVPEGRRGRCWPDYTV
jgi:hypothetical protein